MNILDYIELLTGRRCVAGLKAFLADNIGASDIELKPRVMCKQRHGASRAGRERQRAQALILIRDHKRVVIQFHSRDDVLPLRVFKKDLVEWLNDLHPAESTGLALFHDTERDELVVSRAWS